MGYNDKYPDMSAMYAVQFEYENKLKDKIKELETELERTRKALDVAVDEVTKIKVAAESVGIGFFMTAAIFALEKIKSALEQKD